MNHGSTESPQSARYGDVTAAGKNSKTRAQRKPRNVRGGSGEKVRGSYCTPRPLALAVGRFDLDPFCNPYAHILCDASCMLERGDDGFGDGTPGSYRIAGIGLLRATADTSVWIQPDYSFVNRALDHYLHTRWTALLRFDPRTEWFKRIYRQSEAIRVLWDIQFDPPPGVEVDGKGTNSFPHALFYKRAADVTEDVKRITFGFRKASHNG